MRSYFPNSLPPHRLPLAIPLVDIRPDLLPACLIYHDGLMMSALMIIKTVTVRVLVQGLGEQKRTKDKINADDYDAG